jgi:hypothetical protein
MDKKISQLTAATTPLTGTEELPLVQGGQTLKATAQDIANLAGGGIGGTNYIYVMAEGTDVENAAELSAAYTTAQGMSPSATNRITIVCGPGNYNFSSTTFTMNTQYIDLVSLDGNRSILFNAPFVSSFTTVGTISITANDVFVKGVDVGTKPFVIATNLPLLKVENCKGGDYSFGAGRNTSGTFTNCQGGLYSFGGDGGGTASGTFISCVGDNFAFGGGGPGVLTGKLFYCRLTAGSFKTVSGAGITRLCLDGSNVENNQG